MPNAAEAQFLELAGRGFADRPRRSASKQRGSMSRAMLAGRQAAFLVLPLDGLGAAPCRMRASVW